jgi:hypothetical protein
MLCPSLLAAVWLPEIFLSAVCPITEFIRKNNWKEHWAQLKTGDGGYVVCDAIRQLCLQLK